MSYKNPETIVLHAGYRRDSATNAVAVPIYQTTSYQFDSTQHAADLFALKQFGNIYTRIMNPTCAVLEERITALEGGAASLAVSSGQAASMMAIQNICHAGDNFVSSTDLYGGTWSLFANTLSSMGIGVRFVDPADPENFRAATDARTRCYYAETLPNPKLKVFPIREVAAMGRSLGVPLIVDNTAAPILCKPIEHGAAVVGEHVGGATGRTSLNIAAAGGRTAVGGATTAPTPPAALHRVWWKQLTILGSTMGRKADFEGVYELIASGRARPVVDEVVPLGEIQAAHARLEAGEQLGKIVLRVAD